ncbi:MAG: prepilin-type N-terminal cleavage/methylation domain-containing protein [Alysiella sp.]|uniref:PilW family protein n=1 Tax=Alysiella sp. TaxID=1872483 RepID=UPI0026DC0A6A|nr:prepilin-type N-terminal cleavage/methylation domain-containing protein [Alysiella sp.]MDO4433497.1 prepilin-type N-terminal cleavage/methylation domain-containing protein [Alysiella sp.]
MKNHQFICKVRGFTLIEFLVASALATIVIVAAGGTYFMTRKLNESAQARIEVQDSIRNAATIITRDARGAGSFGCFSTGRIVEGAATATVTPTGAFPDATGIQNGIAGIQFNATENQGYGIIQTTNLDGFPAGFTENGKGALIFIYGKDSWGIKGINGTTSVDVVNREGSSNIVQIKGPMVLSSCNNAYSFTPQYSNVKPEQVTVTLNNIKGKLDTTDISAKNMALLSLSQLYAVAYWVAEVDGKSSLLRMETDINGGWTSPQLLANNVSEMNVNYAYEQNCQVSDKTPGNNVNFKYSSTLDAPNLPALVQIQLKYQYAGDPNDSKSVGGENTHVINAGVRGGSKCSTFVNYSED